MTKDADAFRTISEVAEDLGLPQHVLRFWETKFPQVRPLKRGGGRRYYRRDEVALLRAIRDLLHDDGYTIRGVQRLLKEKGVKGFVATIATGEVQGDHATPDITEHEEPLATPAPSPPDLRRRLEDLACELDRCAAILAAVDDLAADPR